MKIRTSVPTFAIALCVLPASAAPPQPAAGPQCFDAAEVREARQSDDRTLALRLNDQSRYRLDLAEDCPAALQQARPALVSRGGMVCGNPEEYVDLGDRRCAVAGIAKIDAREYSELALRSQRGARKDDDTLDTIEVRSKRTRGFAGTTAYCLDARYMRGWHEDGNDIVVEVSPARSGGNRFYKVEFGGQCPQVRATSALRLESAIGGNAICGNAGDRAVFFALHADPVGLSSPDRSLCNVNLVYPLVAEESRAGHRDR
jgi:hypothetical protein